MILTLIMHDLFIFSIKSTLFSFVLQNKVWRIRYWSN